VRNLCIGIAGLGGYFDASFLWKAASDMGELRFHWFSLAQVSGVSLWGIHPIEMCRILTKLVTEQIPIPKNPHSRLFRGTAFVGTIDDFNTILS